MTTKTTARSLLWAAGLVLCFAAGVEAQYWFLDDFSDGSVTDGSPVTWTSVGDSGDFRVTDQGFEFHPAYLFQTMLQSVLAHDYTHHSVKARLRGVGIGARCDLGALKGYTIFCEPPKTLTLTRHDGGSSYTELGRAPIPGNINVAFDDAWVRFDLSDSLLNVWAWPVGDDMPVEPQIVAIDHVYTHGNVGLFLWAYPSIQNGVCRSVEVSPLDPVWLDMAATDDEYGLSRVPFGDGDTVPTMIGGREARMNQDPESDSFFYFNVEDLFAYQGSKPSLYVAVDYYDTGSGALTLQYDGTSGGIYKSGGTVTLTGTNLWRQHMYTIPDAYFGNRQNGGADFRIAKQGGGTFYLDLVQVSQESFLPSQVGGPKPQDQATGVRTIADLSWTGAEGATSYDVYFGPSDPPAFQGRQTQTTFDPGPMEPLKTHFWRIDAVNGFGTTLGIAWRFTTRSLMSDFDADLDVDQEDFGAFQLCLSGAGRPYATGCEDADLDGDADKDVDQDDLGIFQGCMSGPNVPADPNCADRPS